MTKGNIAKKHWSERIAVSVTRATGSTAAIVIAFLRALQEGPSEEEVDHTARKMDPKAFQTVERGWPEPYELRRARRFARAARIAHLAWLIAEIEGETA